MSPIHLWLVWGALSSPQETPDLAQVLRDLAPPELEQVLTGLPPRRALEEVLAAPTSAEQRRAESARQATDEVTLEVAWLRTEGRYEEAYERFTAHLEDLQAQGIDSGLVRSIEVTLEALGRILDAPEEQRAKFRQADGWTLEVYRAFGDGRWPEARSLAERHLAAVLELFGRDDEEVAASAFNLAQVCNQCGDHAAELPLAIAAVEIRRRLFGADHSLVADALHQLGMCLHDLGRFREAEICLAASLQRTVELFGLESAATLPSLNSLAILEFTLDARIPARLLFEKNLELLADLGGDPRAVEMRATTHDNLAALLRDSFGELDGAESHERTALALRRELYAGKQHNSLSVSLANLASTLCDRGDLDEAEALAREALAGKARLWGPEHPETAREHGLLGQIQLERGDLGGAEREARQAVERLTGAGPGWELDRAQQTMNLGVILLRRGHLDEALELVASAREQYIALYGERHSEIARCTGNLAVVLLAKGRVEEAEALCRAALKMDRELLGSDHPRVATQEERLGELALAAGRLDEAEAHLEEALRVIGVVFGDSSPREARARDELARVHWERGDHAPALEQWRRAFAVADARRGRVLGREREHALYARELRHRDLARALAWAQLDAGHPLDAFLAAERGRDRVLGDLLARSERDLVAELSVQDPEAAKRLQGRIEEEQRAVDREATLQQELVIERKRREPGSEATLAALQRELDAARAARAEAEAAVHVELSAVWPDAQPLAREDLEAAVEPGECLLSYVWSERGVGCVLLPARGEGEPAGFAIASGVEAVAALRTAIDDQRARWSSGAGEPVAALAALLPAPVRARLEAARRVVVLPDGPLGGLAFEALPVGDGRTVLDARAELVYASSASLLVERRRALRARASDTAPRLLAVADPGATGRAVEAGGAGALPGSVTEALAVTRLFDAAGGTARLLSGADAALGEVEEAALGCTHVHLACHGTLGTDDAFRSGLVLADGALDLERLLRAWRGRLSSTRLVVLSACETQLAVAVGDADVSLPWGFFFAGAPSVVATLWKVDDAASALLMARFYENLLGRHPDTRKLGARTFEPGRPMESAAALHEAKLWLRAQPAAANRERLKELGGLGADLRGGDGTLPGAAPVTLPPREPGDFSAPRYWAAFVLFGAGE